MQLADPPETRAKGPPLRVRLSAWRLAARGAAAIGRGNPTRDVWAATLKQVVADLDRLNRHTEEDFLIIGRKLTGFMQTVNLISAELTGLANLLSGEHVPRATKALTDALARSREMSANAEEGNRLLSAMRQEAGRLGQTLSGFHGTLSAFHIVGVLTRVETARLGSAGADFGNLAEDVKLLAANVQAQIAGALATAAELIPPIESLLREISALEEERTHDLPGVISGVLANLELFRDIRQRTRDASIRLAGRYDAIASGFDNLVVSIQFHDITRQQVEHAVAVLRRLISPAAPDTAAVLMLQSSQLADADRKFSASAASIARNLERIAGGVREMAAESQTLSGLSADQKDCFFLELERGLSAILTSFSGCAEAEAAARTASGGMADTIGRMHRSVEEIRAIEIRMRRMALNAGIRAAQLGAPGNALGVLAESMQKLACESGQRSETLVAALTSMSQAAARLGHREPDGAPAPGARDTAQEGMRTAVEELHSLSERSFAQIAQVVARGASLSEDVSAARKAFAVGALFADAIGRARGMLQEIAGETSAGRQRDPAQGQEPELADFTRHYTMQAERDVHQAVAAGAAPCEPPSRESADLGDNVEFF